MLIFMIFITKPLTKLFPEIMIRRRLNYIYLQMHFNALTKQAGVVIMGSKTFKTIGRPLKERKTIVYTSQKDLGPDVICTQEEPGVLLAKLQNEGYKEVAICGGSQIYTLFMKNGLV